jgi:hypothetical protein
MLDSSGYSVWVAGAHVACTEKAPPPSVPVFASGPLGSPRWCTLEFPGQSRDLHARLCGICRTANPQVSSPKLLWYAPNSQSSVLGYQEHRDAAQHAVSVQSVLYTRQAAGTLAPGVCNTLDRGARGSLPAFVCGRDHSARQTQLSIGICDRDTRAVDLCVSRARNDGDFLGDTNLPYSRACWHTRVLHVGGVAVQHEVWMPGVFKRTRAGNVRYSPFWCSPLKIAKISESPAHGASSQKGVYITNLACT